MTSIKSKIAPRSKAMQDAGGFAEALDAVELKPTLYAIPKQGEYRNAGLLERVRQVPCVNCGLVGFTQAAHSMLNQHGRCGFKRKANDSAIMALCGGIGSNHCHESLDGNKALRGQAKADFTHRCIADTYLSMANFGLIAMADGLYSRLVKNYNAEAQATSCIEAMESGEIKLL